MRTMMVKLPDSLNINESEIAMSLAAKLYEEGKLSLGQAAEVAGLTKRTFIELLGKTGVSVFNYPASDLTTDAANA